MVFTYTFAYFLVTVVCALIATTILFQININLGSEQEVLAFRNYLLWYLGFVLSNMVWVWINFGFLKWDGSFFSVINLISICMASYYWFKYVEAKLSTDFVKMRTFRIVSMVPLVIALGFILTTPITKWVFYYNEKNEYIHGPLYPTMFILAVSYLVFATAHITLQSRKLSSKNQNRSYHIEAAFLVFPVAAGLLDIVAENLPVMELALLFGTVLIYTNLLQSQIFTDNVTQLSNRKAVDSYLAEHIMTANEKEPLLFFIGDIDNFKLINDTYGHVEGDKALRLVGMALNKYRENSHNFVARWGGDEFCVIVSGSNAKNPERIIADIRKYIDEESKKADLDYIIEMSMGYAKCISPLASAEKLIDTADDMMYKNKTEEKA